MNTPAPSFFDCISFILVGNNDIHESCDEFEISSDECYNVLTPFCQVSRKLSSKFAALK